MIPVPRADRPHSKTNDHTWIIASEENIKNWKMPQSSSREDYVIPSMIPTDVPRVGSRRQLYQMFFQHESRRQVSQKLKEEENISEKTTEYMGSFNWWNCPQIAEDKEMQRKFPLYSKEPCSSFWKENACSIPGLTPSLDAKRIFHKNTSFTKPINEVLDEPFANCGKEVSTEKWHKYHSYGNKIKLEKSFYF
ncbi:uncharacterized protein LOC124167236 [Ischnura elegans]|uniref:uncharacterized protein LOC124167236 n=1 Tax=Ischnura elegans TaxID=197161 RepID=UPI001ED889F5|nr:uncharacterized protein LOC124167236 [Ischnura elegans]XP_046401065.1 uncharacterized protein LOC124167236 [Ischnura elegans]